MTWGRMRHRLLKNGLILFPQHVAIRHESRAREFAGFLERAEQLRNFPIRSKALRGIAEMKRERRLAPFRKDLQPAEPAGKISGREHFGKDDVIASDIRRAGFP